MSVDDADSPSVRYDSIMQNWVITAPPNILLRAKKWFDGATMFRSDKLTFADSTSMRRDLEAFLHRFPYIEVNKRDKRAILRGTREHKNRESAVKSLNSSHTEYLATPNVDYTPRAYQREAYNLISVKHGHGGLLLADELGLGKTITSLQSLHDPAMRPALVVTLTGLEQQWARELNNLFPELKAHVATKRAAYDLGKECPDLIVMNYAKLQGWPEALSGVVKTVIFDEVQELRVANTNKHDAALMIAGPAVHRWGLSATPVSNYGGELYNIMKVLSPDVVGDNNEFDREWCRSLHNGKKVIRHPEALRSWLMSEGVFLRRTRADVDIELPELTAVEHEIPEALLDAPDGEDLVEFAKAILDESLKGQERFTMSGELSWKLRRQTGLRKANAVSQLAKVLLESEEKIILAGWHRDVWDVWQSSLAEYNPVLYSGTESPKQKAEAFKRFTDGDARILMMSLRSGAGLDGLQGSCNTVLFGELDWSPGVHKQLIGRLHRPGQRSHVTAYFAYANSGSDPVILDTLDVKRLQADLLIKGELSQEPVESEDRIRALALSVLRQKNML